MREEKLDVERLAEITAYHEASHFILALLMNKFDNSFEKPKKATIKVIIGERYKAEITVNIPGILHKELANDETQRIRQTFGSCFVLLSGYYSYNVFYDGNGSSIMETVSPEDCEENILAKDFEMKLFTLNDKLDDILYHPFYGENHDFRKTIDLLRKLWECTENHNLNDLSEHAIVLFLFNELQKLMEGEAVKDSIELVKNELLKNNGKVIEGKDLNDLIANAAELIVNVDITEYLDACEKAYRNDDWYVPIPLPSSF